MHGLGRILRAGHSGIASSTRSFSVLDWPARVKGTQDHLPSSTAEYQFVERTLRDVCEKYCFQEVRTPILERAALFKRALGETTDIVMKEMFQFDDHGTNLILRPENTACVMRALSQGTITKSQKFYYSGPMFRRERPQKGRYRQFEQFGVELIGSNESSPRSDAEVVELGAHCLQSLGLLDAVSLDINSLGDADSRERYRWALVEYLEPLKQQLSALSQDRLNRGAALRILDSKEKQDILLLETAPSLDQYLSESSAARFREVRRQLDAMSVKYTVNPRLVRGLDYYCHTAFEFIDISNAGRQSAVLAGGRYDGLLATKAGAVPAVGWAAGVDRLVLLRQHLGSQLPAPPSLVTVVAARIPGQDNEAVEDMAMQVTARLRRRSWGTPVRIGRNFHDKLKAQMRESAKGDARVVCVIGAEEVAKGVVMVKNMDKNEQEAVSMSDLEAKVADILESNCV